MALNAEQLAKATTEAHPALIAPAKRVVEVAMKKVVESIQNPPPGSLSLEFAPTHRTAYVVAGGNAVKRMYQIYCDGIVTDHGGNISLEGSLSHGLTVDGHLVGNNGGANLTHIGPLPRDVSMVTQDSLTLVRGINPLSLFFLAADLEEGLLVSAQTYFGFLRNQTSAQKSRG